MDPKVDKLVRRTTMIATATASYFLLTADYGPEPNFLDPIRNALQSAGQSAKEFVIGVMKKETPQSETKKPTSTASEKHP